MRTLCSGVIIILFVYLIVKGVIGHNKQHPVDF